MPDATRFSHPVRLSALKGAETPFDIAPGAGERRAIADALGIRALRKLRFAGTLVPQGRSDWRLEGMLGATAVQDCVVTLDPVTTRIDAPVRRSYLADPPDLPEGEEVEMPQDDTVEPLPATLDLAQVMIEALALALPDYPRAEGVAPLAAQFTEPGGTPMTDDDAKPFAGLAGLRGKLKNGDA